MQEYCINVCWESWIECAGWRWLSLQVLIHNLPKSALKGRAACQQFIGHNGKCILVGGRNGVTFQLFRCHIRWGTTDTEAGTGGCCSKPCNAEVSQQQVRAIRILLVTADKKVGRFDIL